MLWFGALTYFLTINKTYPPVILSSVLKIKIPSLTIFVLDTQRNVFIPTHAA